MTPEEIKRIRRESGLSVDGLARVLDLAARGADYVRELERGKRDPSGPIRILLEMLDRGELPDRFFERAGA